MGRIPGRASTALTFAWTLVLGCTSPLVTTDLGEGTESDGDESGPMTSGVPQPSDDDAPASDDEADDDITVGDGSAGTDAANDDSDDISDESEGDDTDTGEPVVCPASDVSNVRAEVWPGTDPLGYSQILRELECVIQQRIMAGEGVSLQMACTKDGVPLPELVIVGVEAAGIDVPASLVAGVSVQARVYTGRDLEEVGEYPWRRADHFALFRDGVLVLGAGAGASLPTGTDGEPFVDFWSPFELGDLPSTCPGESLECHALLRGVWTIAANGTATMAPPFSVVQIADYDVHFGELVNEDALQCDEPPYRWMSFAIAPS